jgi:hypothetical protein
LPVLAGVLSGPIAFSLVSEDLGPVALSPLVLFFLSCNLWWLAPAVLGAGMGAVIGAINSAIFSENLEVYGEAISVASAMMTMLLTGAFVWLIKFL